MSFRFPSQKINETKVFTHRSEEDVRRFHPVNVGKMMIGEADYLPARRRDPAAPDPLGVKTDGRRLSLSESNISANRF